MYQIRDKADQVVARLRLPRDAYRLGEVVHALIDFASASQPTFKVRCGGNTARLTTKAAHRGCSHSAMAVAGRLQVSAFLETFESVAEVYLARDEESSQRSTRQVREGVLPATALSKERA